MSKDIDLIWQKINCEACYNENINYCKEKCECKCREFKALENILSQLQELGEINFNLLNNGVPKEAFDKLRLKLKKEKKENEANKKRIEELEEENKELMKLKKDHSYSVDVVRQNTKLRYELFNSIPKAKVENLLKTKIIEYDCEDCITGKFIEVEDVEELLKYGGN